jgi:hypothetical protein
VPEGKAADGRPRDHFVVVEEALRPLAQRLRVSRRDLERARQILLAQRRLAPSRRRRARPMALVRRDYFGEALTLYEMMARTVEQVGEEIGRWRALSRRADQGGEVSEHEIFGAPGATGRGAEGGLDEGGPRKRRRRRRGGRRRRRAMQGMMDSGEPLAAVVSADAADAGSRGPGDDAAS